MQHSKAPHAIVIGAGFGGLASAIRLRSRGYRVTLLEANEQTGGRASAWHQDGFVFDAGPTVITAPYLFDELFDSVGRDTFMTSLDCLRPRGLMVSFGNASGAPAPLELQTLTAKGSLYITRPTMVTYTATPEELQQSSEDLFARIRAGEIKVEINQRYALADVQQAHIDLEGRRTTGSTILLP